MSWNEAIGNKIAGRIEKLTKSNVSLKAKIDANRDRIRALVGKFAGVKPGDVVTWKGERYQVTDILSDVMPAKGTPVLSGIKLLKNGKATKRETEIKGAWKAEKTAAAPATTAPAKRRGRPPKASVVAARATRVSRKAALAAIAPEGTA